MVVICPETVAGQAVSLASHRKPVDCRRKALWIPTAVSNPGLRRLNDLLCIAANAKQNRQSSSHVLEEFVSDRKKTGSIWRNARPGDPTQVNDMRHTYPTREHNRWKTSREPSPVFVKITIAAYHQLIVVPALACHYPHSFDWRPQIDPSIECA